MSVYQTLLTQLRTVADLPPVQEMGKTYDPKGVTRYVRAWLIQGESLSIISESRMKDIFTSLGFGATTANNFRASIRKSLNTQQYDALMSNKTFGHIEAASNLVRNTIANHFKAEDFEFRGMQYRTNVLDHKGNPEKRSVNQKLAWIYQVMESEAVTEFGDRAQARGYDPLLFAHDCVYFKRKPVQDLVDDIMYFLNQKFPLLRIEYEAVYPIFKQDKPRTWIEYDRMVESHQSFIDAEEMAAESDEVFDPLDPNFGHFVEEIRALNPRVGQGLGTLMTFKP